MTIQARRGHFRHNGDHMSEPARLSHENRRRAYLRLMNIQPYYARLVFENAKPSPVVPVAPMAEAPIEAAPPTDSEPAAEFREPPSAGKAQGSGRLEEPPETAPASPGQAFCYRRIDETLALAATDSWEGGNGAKCRVLLTNILKALGKAGAIGDADSQAETAFLDPRAGQRPDSQGAALEHLCRRDRCPNLLVFAHNGNDLFPSTSTSPSAPDFLLSLGGNPVRVTVTHGLREMLAFPDLKKLCWSHLQPLRARLSR